VQEVDQTLAESFKLERPAGALVNEVEKDSAAERAGLASGDVVLAFNGRPIELAGDLSANVSLAQPGDQVEIAVWRQGAKQRLHAQLGDAVTHTPPTPTKVTAAPNPVLRFGLLLSPPKPEGQHASGLASGLLVEGVSGAAEHAGVQSGDVLLAINAKPVTSIDQAGFEATRSDKSVALLVLRDGMKIYIALRLG
jgi:serine protease Do